MVMIQIPLGYYLPQHFGLGITGNLDRYNYWNYYSGSSAHHDVQERAGWNVSH